MSNQTTIEAIEQLVKVDDTGKEDHRVWTGRMAMDPESGFFGFDMTEPRRHAESDGINGLKDRQFNATDHALSQICGRVGIPSADWMRKNPKKLQADIYNYWINQTLRTALVRMRNNTIRGFLTNEYVPVNNTSLVSAIKANMPKQFKTEIRYHWLSDTHFGMKVLFPDLTREFKRQSNGKTEVMKVGVCFSNSEVGCGSIRVEPFIYRLACTNDAMVEQDKAWRQAHRWITEPRLNQHLEAAIANSLKDGADAVLDFERLDTQGVKEPEKAIEEILKMGKFGKKHIELAQAEYHKEPGDTRFACLNAVTAMGRLLPDLERLEVERFAGKMMRRKNWGV